MPQKIEITTKTILTTIGILLGISFAYQLRYILLEVFVALIIMAAVNPFIEKLQKFTIAKKKYFNRLGAAVFVYLVGVCVFSLFATLVAQPLAQQTASLINQLPQLLNSLGSYYPIINTEFFSQFVSQIGGISSNIFQIVTGLFSNLLTVLTTVIISFYLLLERPNFSRYLSWGFRNPPIEKHLLNILDLMEDEMGTWVRAQLTLMVLVGILSYVGFVLLGIPFALPLAIVAGFLELLPGIGPSIAMFPALIAGFSSSSLQGIGTLAWCVIVQQIEGNVIVPQVMSRNTGVRPLITLLALIIGFALDGFPGAMLAIPTVLVCRAILQEFYPAE